MQNVLITGGAGYLGRAYLRWAKQSRPDVHFTIFSRDEGKHARCRREFPECRYVIGDVRDEMSVDLAVAGHDTVIHAAAFKYVPQAETAGIECMKINAGGSLNVAHSAIRHGVARVVGISTDKACSPLNNYGLTKLAMERFFQQLDAEKHGTQFNLVRYGNVVSSTGSVIPIFKRQLADQGFITLTDPGMTRFWLSVEDAVALINLALDETEGGTNLIPRCPSISMGELAATVTENIKVVGLRQGEKRHESLLNAVEGQWTDYGLANVPGGFHNGITGAMRLFPLATKARGNPVSAYESDRPDHTLTPAELQAMIDGALE